MLSATGRIQWWWEFDPVGLISASTSPETLLLSQSRLAGVQAVQESRKDVCVSHQLHLTLATPYTSSLCSSVQDSPGQEYWTGLPWPPPGASDQPSKLESLMSSCIGR